MGQKKTHERQLHQARPPLRLLAPMCYYICWIFASVNIWVFISLCFIYKPTTPLLIVNEFFTFQFWGILFGVLAIVGIYSLLTNKWELTRKTLLFGIILKSAWAITLVLRTFISPHTTILTTVLWFFFTLTQVVTFIFFIPPSTQPPQGRRIDE